MEQNLSLIGNLSYQLTPQQQMLQRMMAPVLENLQYKDVDVFTGMPIERTGTTFLFEQLDAIESDSKRLFAFVGESGSGKGHILKEAASLIRKIRPDIRVVITTFADALVEGESDPDPEKRIPSDWTMLEPRHFALATERMREHMNQALDTSEGPTIVIAEFVGILPPLNVGNSLMEDALQRRQKDSHFNIAVWGTATREKQWQAALRSREAIAEAQSPNDLQAILRRRRIVPVDEKGKVVAIDPAAFIKSSGNPDTMRKTRLLADMAIINSQDDIRQFGYPDLPQLTLELLETNPLLREQAEAAYLQYVVQYEWNIPSHQSFIAFNNPLEHTLLPLHYETYLRRSAEKTS